MPSLMMMAFAGGLVGFGAAILATSRCTWSPSRPSVRLRALDLHRGAKAEPKQQRHIEIFRSEPSTWLERLRQRIGQHAVGIGGLPMIWLVAVVVIATFILSLLTLNFLDASGSVVAISLTMLCPLLAGTLLHGQLKRRWQLAFLNGFADAIELVIRASRSGIPISEAIRVAGQEIADPVRSEFRLISNALDLGIDLKDALRTAASRVCLPDFDFLVTALILQRETGGQLAETLENLATILRRRKELRLKIKAMTAEGRMSAVVVGAIPLVAAAAMYFLDPGHIERLLVPGAGRSMLYVGIGLLAAGIAIIHFLTRVRP
ncbi:type II secretion system F family protein [Geminicoccus roseus]|uniref:type II secretion system F family protein n=1 Tax=Geminicoccus roseus TaxID=404900 RepID=UPI00068908D8|nr:type II secretion system F family protein [Geminicoccus roseus]